MAHFTARKMMNIDSLGEETIEAFYNNNLIKNIADLYELKLSDLIDLERLGENLAMRKAVPAPALVVTLQFRINDPAGFRHCRIGKSKEEREDKDPGHRGDR